MKKNVLLFLFFTLAIHSHAVANDGRTLYEKVVVSSGKEIAYAIHLPDGFDPSDTYPVLIGPGEGVKGSEAGFYWKTDAHSHGWIIVDAHLWESDTKTNISRVLDAVAAGYTVERNKFHAVCWSANSAGIFRLVIDNANRFHSVTGMAGNPSSLSSSDIEALRQVKVQFVVGERDRHWQRSARRAYEQLEAGGVDSALEIVPNGEHVMTELVGKKFMQRLERLR